MSVEITQADREAAAALMALIDAGDAHCDDFTAAFAKHRSTSTEEVERLRAALRACADAPFSGWTIAQAIARTALGATSHAPA